MCAARAGHQGDYHSHMCKCGIRTSWRLVLKNTQIKMDWDKTPTEAPRHDPLGDRVSRKCDYRYPGEPCYGAVGGVYKKDTDEIHAYACQGHWNMGTTRAGWGGTPKVYTPKDRKR